MRNGARETARGLPRALIAIALAAGVLTGCSAPAPAPTADASAKALLDQTTGEIVMPISAYDILDSNRDLETLNHALRVYVGHCMEDQGFEYAAGRAGDEDRIVDDRPYGLWFEPAARVYGFGFQPSAVEALLAADREAGGADWEAAEQQCSTDAQSDDELTAFMPTNDELNTSIVPTIRTEAYQLASADPRWQQAREEWWQCLRDEGLEPLTGATDWDTEGSQPVSVDEHGQPTWSEASIAIAFRQAQCNNETGLTQTLGDLEASYQAPLIVQHQAALNEWKSDKQSRLAAAADYITRNG